MRNADKFDGGCKFALSKFVLFAWQLFVNNLGGVGTRFKKLAAANNRLIVLRVFCFLLNWIFWWPRCLDVFGKPVLQNPFWNNRIRLVYQNESMVGTQRNIPRNAAIRTYVLKFGNRHVCGTIWHGMKTMSKTISKKLPKIKYECMRTFSHEICML